MPRAFGYEMSVSGRDDGTLEALYIRFGGGKVKRTEEIIEGVLLVDYGAKKQIVGIEVLAPVRLSQLTRLVDEQHRPSFRKFVRRGAPEELVTS